MNIKELFRHKKETTDELKPLKVDGVGEAPMTPEADEAEVAAQALLEIICDKLSHKRKHRKGHNSQQSLEQSAAYYHNLAERLQLAYDGARQRTLRFLSYCEQELRKPNIPVTGKGSLMLIESELYKRINIADREGGTLKARWQHCLAEVTVRLMEAERKGFNTDNDQ